MSCACTKWASFVGSIQDPARDFGHLPALNGRIGFEVVEVKIACGE